MVTLRARIPPTGDHDRILPVAVPDTAEVRQFAFHLHGLGKGWEGQVFGWLAAYSPRRRRRPPGSKMTFTPAEFWIGESGIWFYSLMWEKGGRAEPVEFIDDRGIVR
jgi:hypothetical protein